MIYMLHIADLHFVKNATSFNTEEIVCREAKEKVKGIPKGQKLLIVTGDFHNFSDKDYKKAEDFLTRLAKDMCLEMKEDVFVIPGNHDVGNEDTLQPLLEKEDSDWKLNQEAAVSMLKNGDMRFIKKRLSAFRPYSEFVRKLGIYDDASACDLPAMTHVRTWNGKQKLNILHLNTALIADGKTKTDQMTDTDTASNAEMWNGRNPEHIPAIAIAHNSYYDLRAKQRLELSAAFSLWNIHAYMCGDRHRTERNPEQQMIRLESGHRSGKEIPNLVAARGIADGNDDYSEVGFCWHTWDEDTGKVTVEFRKWTPNNYSKTIPEGETGEYDLYCAKSASSGSAITVETKLSFEGKDPDEKLKADLNNLLIREKNAHPSFQLMKLDEVDVRIMPGIKEIVRFPIRGTLVGKEQFLLVRDLIEKTWKDPENHSVVIEGAGGIGKTVTLFSIAEQEDGHPKVSALYIPMFDLVDKDGKSLNLTQYLKNRFPATKADAIRNLAAKHWQGPSLLLLLDGFNEIPVSNRLEILNLLRKWRVDHPGAQIIAVSRPLDGINLSQSLGEGTISIRLAPLEKKSVQEYIRNRMSISKLPSDNSKIWDFLVYPLFLTLYLKTDFSENRAYGYPLLLKRTDGPGGIIWNYLQRELLRIPNEEWVIRCAIACEYILPRIAYEMLCNNQFTMERSSLRRLIQETWKTLNPLVLPAHLGELFDTFEDRHPGNFPTIEQSVLIETVIKETGLLSEYQDHQKRVDNKRTEKRYSFIHQHFRDCLAGIYLVNQAEMAGENELSKVWQHGQSHLALDYAAELMSPLTVEKLWECNRRKQQDGSLRYGPATTFALLELQKRHNPLSQTLNFSGMDLRGQSLTRYMGLGGVDLSLFRKASLTNKTKLDRATFQSEGHISSVTCIALYPDGRVVSGSNDNTLRVWDATTGQCLQTLKGHTDQIRCVAVFPDGRVISGSNDNTLRVWDAVTGQCLQILEWHTSMINCIILLPDGRVVSGSSDYTLGVWDAATSQCLQTMEGHKDRITCMAVLPDGRVVSGSDDGNLRVWDASTGKCLITFKGHTDLIICVAILPDGRVVSGSHDNTIRVWDTTSGECLQTLWGHTSPIKCLAVLPDGRVVSGSDDHTLRVWNATTGKCFQILKEHTDIITCVSILPDGRVVSCSNDHTLRIWDVTTGKCLQTLEGHLGRISCVSILSDGRVVSGSEDGALRVWDTATGQCLQILRKYEFGVNCLATSQDGRVVSGSHDNTLRVWDATTGQCLQILKGHTDEIKSVAIFPNGLLVSSSHDNTLRVWDVASGKCQIILEGHTDGINCLAVIPENRVISGSDDETLRVWDVVSGECQKILEGHTDGITCVDVLLDGRVVSGSDDETLVVWDAASGQCLQTLEGHTGKITCLAILPKGQVVSGSRDNTLRIWDANSGRCLNTLKGHTYWIDCIAVLPGNRVVSGSHDRTLRVWDASTGKCLQTLEGHTSWINCVAALTDGRVVSGSCDNTLRVWDTATGTLRILEGHTGMITYIGILPDDRIISCSDDCTLRVWDPDNGKCLDVLEATEVDVSKMDFSQARLTGDLVKLLWHNGAKISQADYEHWVKPSRNP